MTDPRAPRPTRPPYFWLSVAGGVVGISLLGLRIATLPAGDSSPVLVGVLLALALTVALFAAHGLRIRAWLRRAAREYPEAVLIPIAVGTATAVATRWIAERVGDPALRLRSSSNAIVALDAAGLHVVTSRRARHGHLPPAAISLGPLGRTIVGLREVDALVLEVEADGLSAPLSLVPMRLGGIPLTPLSDAELLAVTARIEDALAARPVEPGWGY